MAKKKTKFACQHCGYETPKWLGKCPGCNQWNSFVEEIEVTTNSKRAAFQPHNHEGAPKPTKLLDVKIADEVRITTRSVELDRVLGGGIVHGSLVLIGGDPGIGKSTLLLQTSSEIAASGERVLYISGEESVKQIRLRAERLDAKSDDLYVLAETDLERIVVYIEEMNPSLVIIDSIQTIYLNEVSSAPGSVSQVRECTGYLMKVAKTKGIPIFIVGHVTKEGSIAGPRILEHMVDTVLYFEGDRHHEYRILRSVKNRFGSTNELGIFEMKGSGLQEVLNPSEIFLEERTTGVSGSTVVASIEGTRPLLVEIQALVSPTTFNNPRRMATGIDHNRVSLLLAVLEKKAGFLLQSSDAYLKVAGGVKLDEPAIDLSIVLSVASSFKDVPTPAGDVYIGEVGLTGEIRRVSRIEQRVQEAAKLGFKRAIIPAKNVGGWEFPKDMQIIGIDSIGEALKIALGGG